MDTPGTSPTLPQGAHLTAAGVAYRIWAPEAARIELEIVDAGKVVRRQELTRDTSGFHSGLDSAGRAGDCYRYRVNGGDSFPDPASRWQPAGVHEPSMVIDAQAYRWQTENFARPAFRDLIIYELHIGTFTPAGTFRGAIERLPYLQALGINAIEIMPIADFAGERNWGYDGVSLYAPAHAYGHPDDLRALIDAAHVAGLAVILDVVYNHFGPSGNYLFAYIGDYLDETAKTPWGGAIRYGSPEFRPLREFVIANLDYWMEAFRIDGFRLDATHAIVDATAGHILSEMTDRIHARGGYAIAEDSRNDARVVRPIAEGGFGFDAVWADDFHHTTRVAMTQEREAYLADFTGTLPELAETLRRGWYYCGQHSPFLGQPRGTPSEGLPPGSCICCISNHDQTGNRALGERLGHLITNEAYRAASALLCLTPHTPLLFMGQEWAASTPFLFFTDHEEELGRLVTAGRREEFKDFAAFHAPGAVEQIPDPQQPRTLEASRLNWQELDQPPHRGTLELYRACLALRREHPAFRPQCVAEWWVEATDFDVCALGFTSGTGEWLLLVDLIGGHAGPTAALPVQISPERWHRVLSTREQRFGGDGGSALSPQFDTVRFDRPEVVLLHRIITPKADAE